MKKILLYISLCFFAQLSAQELSLVKALELANSPQNKQADLEILKQEINLKIQKNKRLPLIYGDVNVQRNLIVPVTPVPAIAFNPNAAAGDITPLKFATDWSAKAGLQFSLDLFNAQNQLNIKQAENSSKKSELSKKQTAEDFNKLIIDLYAQTYLAQQQYELALINEAKFKETLNVIILRNKAGRSSDLEKNNALQKAYDLELTSDEAEYVLKNKLLQLANYIDITKFESVSTSIDEIVKSDFKSANYDVAQLQMDIDSKQIEIENNQRSVIPKVSLNAFYGSQFFNNQLNLTNSQYWYGNSFVNLTLRIPLTEYYEKNLKKKQFNYELEIAKSKLEALELDTEISDLKRKNDLLVLQQKISAYKQMVNLAEQNVNIVKAQVDEGTVLISEYNKEIENLLAQNKKLWQAYYDLLLKQLE